MRSITVVDNAIAKDALTILRDKHTTIDRYRLYSDQLCHILLTEALSNLELTKHAIQTPLATTTGEALQSEHIVVIPILRAGLAMLRPALQLLPKAKVGFIGLARDETTAVAKEYYRKFPLIEDTSTIVIVDPMLATGGSMMHLLSELQSSVAKEIRIVSVVSAPEGIEKVLTEFPDVKIITAAVDDHLNDRRYIIPGLGDYGDRYFGTG